jgi:hypothetical protein
MERKRGERRTIKARGRIERARLVRRGGKDDVESWKFGGTGKWV